MEDIKPLTGPEKFGKILNYKRDEIINKIEHNFNIDQIDTTIDYISVIISGEYSKEVRDHVVKDYMKRGWSNVTHITSSENGERAGLTLFKFYF